MDLIICIVVLWALAKGILAIGGVHRRVSLGGFFGGMFAAPTLGWPTGVQEEDRDRIWSWEAPLPTPASGDPAAVYRDPERAFATLDPDLGGGEIEDVATAPIPVRRVRGRARW